MNDVSGPANGHGLTAAAKVDQDRLWNRHMQMAEFGAIPGNGVNRQALSAEDIAARHLLLSWAEPRGYEIAVDDIANLYVRRAGTDPGADPILTGSHMDSQPSGGRFDGIYGVLAGLEVLDALDDAGLQTRRPIEVVAWTNEEGSRFTPGCMGSQTFAGARNIEDFVDIADADGVYFGNALDETLAATPRAERRPFGFPVAAYIEAHIEQGPILEDAERVIGVVTNIQGLRWFNVEVTGETAHAGTCPVGARRDAFQAAVRAVQALNALTADAEDKLRFTVGKVQVSPNSPNSVADNVQFTIDLRHTDLDVLNEIGDAFPETCRAAAAPCDATVTETFRKNPTRFDAGVVDVINAAADALSLPNMQMPSGAFHDAGFLNESCPTAMLFIPSLRGVSHNVAEYSSPEQLADGARVLAAALYELANRP